jgi:predicted enzyme related to lactoylglutathione lyase
MMSERDRYEHGVPCWVETLQPDPAAAIDFYGRLFGWRFDGPGAMADGEGNYFVATLAGSEVAGLGCQPQEIAGDPAAWNTQVRVDDVDATADRVRAAGGSVVAGPLDVPPAGRLIVIADPAGAVLCAWEASGREGAERVNEPGAWSMSVLNTPDQDSAEGFYGVVFGWRSDTLDPENGIKLWRLPGYVGGEPRQPVPRDVVAVMAPLESNGTGRGRAHWAIDFWVHDADHAADQASANGGRVVVAPYDIPMFRQAVLADPWGAVFSVSQLMLR